MRGQADDTQVTRLALVQQKLLVQHLQTHSPVQQRDRRDPHTEEQEDTPALECRVLRITTHGLTITMLSADRTTMPRRSRAATST